MLMAVLIVSLTGSLLIGCDPAKKTQDPPTTTSDSTGFRTDSLPNRTDTSSRVDTSTNR